MLNNIVIGRYFETKSKIHSMNPFSKIICMIIYIILLFLSDDASYIIIMIVFISIITLLSNVPLKIYLKSIYGMRYLIVSLLIINLLSGLGIAQSIISVSKIILIVLYSTILSLTTKKDDLMNGLEILFSPLVIIKVPVKKMAFILTNSIMFIPILIDNTNDFLKSQCNYFGENNNLKEKINNFKGIIIPITAHSFNSLDRFIAHLELKLYSFEEKKTRIKAFRFFDTYLLCMHIMLIFVYGRLK